MWVTKLLISPVKKRIFCPKTTKFGPNLAFLSIAGSFGALLVGWLVVVARGLYLARHLFIYFINVLAVLLWTVMDVCCNYANGQNFVHTIKREGVCFGQPPLQQVG